MTTASHLASGAADPALAAITIMGSGRIGPTITALIGLAALVLAARRLARARHHDRAVSQIPGDRPLALVLGVAAVVLGGVFLAAADSGPGTGDGVVGSGAAIIFGVLAIGLDRFAAGRRATEAI